MDFPDNLPRQFRDFQVFGFAFCDGGLCFDVDLLRRKDGVKIHPLI